MNYLSDKNFVQTISSGKVVVLFTAPWCGFCPQMKKTLESTLSDLGPHDFSVYGCDVELCPESADTMQLMSLPTMIMFDKGFEVKRLSGSQSPAATATWLTS